MKRNLPFNKNNLRNKTMLETLWGVRRVKLLTAEFFANHKKLTTSEFIDKFHYQTGIPIDMIREKINNLGLLSLRKYH
jgi:hypothetical protein